MVRDKFFLLNNKGFSLVEVMVSAGIMGIALMTSQHLFKVQTAAKLERFNKYTLSGIKERVATVVADQSSCTESFQNVNATSGNVPGIIKVTPNGNITLMSVNDTFSNNKIELTSMSFSSFNRMGPIINDEATGFARLEFIFSIKQFLGSSLRTIKIVHPVFVVINTTNNLIKDCQVGSSITHKELCDTLGGTLTADRCQNLNIYESITVSGTVSGQNLATTAGTLAALQASVGDIHATTIDLNQGLSPPPPAPNSVLLNSGGTITTQNIDVPTSLEATNQVIAPQFCKAGVCTTFPSYNCPAGQYIYRITNTLQAVCTPFPARRTVNQCI